MVTYQVQLPEANEEAFLNIIRSLKSLGVIVSFDAVESLAVPGNTVSIENLLQILEDSEKQVAHSEIIPGHQVKDFFALWQASR